MELAGLLTGEKSTGIKPNQSKHVINGVSVPVQNFP